MRRQEVNGIASQNDTFLMLFVAYDGAFAMRN
jgi:hypothetical protein